MEEPPAPQGDPPNTLPLQCVLKEDECSNLHWQDVTDKIGTSQNSRLLFLTVSKNISSIVFVLFCKLYKHLFCITG